METMKELETYLEKECYSFREITIGKHFAYEGIIIEKYEECYIFASSERGRKEVLKSFPNEKELVDYAFSYITKEKWFRSHLVAWVWNRTEIEQAEAELGRKTLHLNAMTFLIMQKVKMHTEFLYLAEIVCI